MEIKIMIFIESYQIVFNFTIIILFFFKEMKNHAISLKYNFKLPPNGYKLREYLNENLFSLKILQLSCKKRRKLKSFQLVNSWLIVCRKYFQRNWEFKITAEKCRMQLLFLDEKFRFDIKRMY